MAFPSRPESLARKVHSVTLEAESLGLTTATLTLRTARFEIGCVEPEQVATMPKSNHNSKPN
jgi:hypothetical protein